jgi:putative transposase
MAAIEKGYHCVYSLKYHVVWITKNRYSKCYGSVENEAKNILKQIAQDYDWEIEEMDVSPDHIHIYISTEPTDKPSDVIKRLKEESSKTLGSKYPFLKNKKGAVWGRGYFITTVNDKTTSEQIKRYIRNQKTVAAQGTLFKI